MQINRNLAELSPRFHEKRRRHWPGNVHLVKQVKRVNRAADDMEKIVLAR